MHVNISFTILAPAISRERDWLKSIILLSSPHDVQAPSVNINYILVHFHRRVVVKQAVGRTQQQQRLAMSRPC